MIVVLGGISHVWRPVMRTVPDARLIRCRCVDREQCRLSEMVTYDRFYDQIEDGALVIAAGWRHMVPKAVLDRTTVVGFHHARLPEYPGRAPIPWTLLRGDMGATVTMLYLDEGPDTGDIIDYGSTYVDWHDTATTLYVRLGIESGLLLAKHLPGILDGTAPRHPQDMSKRGPLTTADGWQRLGQSL